MHLGSIPMGQAQAELWGSEPIPLPKTPMIQMQFFGIFFWRPPKKHLQLSESNEIWTAAQVSPESQNALGFIQISQAQAELLGSEPTTLLKMPMIYMQFFGNFFWRPEKKHFQLSESNEILTAL